MVRKARSEVGVPGSAGSAWGFGVTAIRLRILPLPSVSAGRLSRVSAGDEREMGAVARSHNGEVASIQRGQDRLFQALAERDYRGIHETEVAVCALEFRCPRQIGAGQVCQ